MEEETNQNSVMLADMDLLLYLGLASQVTTQEPRERSPLGGATSAMTFKLYLCRLAGVELLRVTSVSESLIRLRRGSTIEINDEEEDEDILVRGILSMAIGNRILVMDTEPFKGAATAAAIATEDLDMDNGYFPRLVLMIPLVVDALFCSTISS